MDGVLPADSLQIGTDEGALHNNRQLEHGTGEDGTGGGGRWYYSRKEIEENSASRKDGIDLKKETYLRKSYCTFLQDLGMRLKVPQVTIATAIVFCHRFFLRQSHVRNDRRTIATVCMFLAGKVEETPRPLKDVILVSYEIIHKKDPDVAQRIKQKEVYEQQKELILMGERVVLATLGFDLNVHHPYKPLVEAIKKFKVAQNALAQVAWNFVNDGLRTSLCLQFKPHHIAAGAIFLAGKFLKVKLPSDGVIWRQEFDVHPHQLEEVSNQMLELYEQNKVPPTQTSEDKGSAAGGPTPRAPTKAPTSEEHVKNNSSSYGRGATSKPVVMKSGLSRPVPNQPYLDNNAAHTRTTQNGYDHAGTDINGKPDHKKDIPVNDVQHFDSESLHYKGNTEISRSDSEGHVGIDQKGIGGRSDAREIMDTKDKWNGRYHDHKDGKLGYSPRDAVMKIDKDKVKAALERKKARGATTRRTDFIDEDDLIERELEDGIELAAESERSRSERKQNWSNNEHEHHLGNRDDHGDDEREKKWQSPPKQVSDNVEEGEVPTSDDTGRAYQLTKSNYRKRKAGSSLDKEGKGREVMAPAFNQHVHNDYQEDRDGLAHLQNSEEDNKNHV
ncbi:Cyclin-T1-5 like [Heracleum sosnowskyi]|uniref:Cyclin-T1-5 like n=1 Tax=Heracleum sosnowskyi TaxID=360622 RepID=A0AAD8GWN0_9APIA|nr:Cyclin-T1-5 like [Heracleum sosnowskyi]